jgi:hypothetical protein
LVLCLRRKYSDEELLLILEDARKQMIELKAKLDVLLEKLDELERECIQS